MERGGEGEGGRGEREKRGRERGNLLLESKK